MNNTPRSGSGGRSRVAAALYFVDLERERRGGRGKGRGRCARGKGTHMYVRETENMHKRERDLAFHPPHPRASRNNTRTTKALAPREPLAVPNTLSRQLGLNQQKTHTPSRSFHTTIGGTVYPPDDGAGVVPRPSRPHGLAGRRGARRPRLSRDVEQGRGGLLLQRDVLPDPARYSRAGGPVGGRVFADSGK